MCRLLNIWVVCYKGDTRNQMDSLEERPTDLDRCFVMGCHELLKSRPIDVVFPKYIFHGVTGLWFIPQPRVIALCQSGSHVVAWWIKEAEAQMQWKARLGEFPFFTLEAASDRGRKVLPCQVETEVWKWGKPHVCVPSNSTCSNKTIVGGLDIETRLHFFIR